MSNLCSNKIFKQTFEVYAEPATLVNARVALGQAGAGELESFALL